MLVKAHAIILEGADGSGKTTLANQLRTAYGYRVLKTNAPSPGEDVFESYSESLLDALNGPPAVLDRHYLGECIYGPLLRGRDRLGESNRDVIEAVIAAHDVAIVVCAPPMSVIESGWRSKDDLLKRIDQLHYVANRYIEEACRLGISVYDWTKPKDDLFDAYKSNKVKKHIDQTAYNNLIRRIRTA